MHEKVQEFLNKRKEEEKLKFEKIKAKKLIELGLYEKEYAPDNKYSEEYSCSEWDSSNSTKYYKIKPFEVTDEEYEEIKKYSLDGYGEVKRDGNSTDVIVKIIKVVAYIVFVVGFISGIVLGVDEYGDISGMMIVWWSLFFIYGIIMLGFAEIIKLLHDIKNK